MDNGLTNGVPEHWKETLRNNMITSIVDNTSKGTKAIEEIGYAYQCYAPAFIYKYFPPIESRLDTIRENMLWYSAPSRFNDVFDSDTQIDEKAVFNSVLYQVSGGKGVREGSPLWRKLYAERPKIMKEFNDTWQKIKCTTGVACFSESYESLLMWSHYADNHQGFCVEYELEKFNSELGFTPVPVIYSNIRTRLTRVDINNSEVSAMSFLINCLTSKSSVWSYENEWRIIRDNNACGEAWDDDIKGALLPSIKPSAIIMGCATTNIIEDVAKEYCNKMKINLFRMEKDKVEYKLNKKPILQF